MKKFLQLLTLCLTIATSLAAGDSRINATGTIEKDSTGLYFQPALLLRVVTAEDQESKVYLDSNESLEKLCKDQQVVKFAGLITKNARGDRYCENYCLKKVE
jgi:hypothetical protein